MNTWLRQHWLSFTRTAARLAENPLASLLNVLVIGVALALPLGGYLLFANLQVFSRDIATEPQISVFLASAAGRQDAAEIQERLRRSPSVRSVQFVGRDEALASLKSRPGVAELAVTLQENPLPDALVVTLARSDAAIAQNLERELKRNPKVAHVQADWAWVRRVDSALRFGRTAVALLAALLGFGLVAVTFNTIRLQILTQAAEIEVSKLIGATDAYVRRPFYYLGTLQGALGGVAALGIVGGSIYLLNRDLSGLSGAFGADFTLQSLGAADGFAVVVFAAALGWVGSYLSVSRHLARNRLQ
ncbi:MAG: ABC transporter permease [Betaproteobacteria bacterium]|nr:ABC transporter permease [Betaproteobacteria bacterium]